MKHTTFVTLDIVKIGSIHKEVTFEIEFDISGSGRPSTLTEPEEFEELEITEVKVVKLDGISLESMSNIRAERLAHIFRSGKWLELTPEEFDNKLEDHCWEYVAEYNDYLSAVEDDGYEDNYREGWD